MKMNFPDILTEKNKVMKKIVFLAAMVLTVPALYAQEAPEKVIEKFFQDYRKGDPAQALDNLYRHMPWSDRIRDELDKMRSQFTGLQSLVGKYYGYDFVVKKELAGSFSVYSYLARFERQPVRFIFKFYKPQDQWFLYGFSYDDDFSQEIEEAVKVYNLK